MNNLFPNPVLKFAPAMGQELQNNNRKTDWQQCGLKWLEKLKEAKHAHFF